MLTDINIVHRPARGIVFVDMQQRGRHAWSERDIKRIERLRKSAPGHLHKCFFARPASKECCYPLFNWQPIETLNFRMRKEPPRNLFSREIGTNVFHVNSNL